MVPLFFYLSNIGRIIDEADHLIKSHFKDEKKFLINYNQKLQISEYSDLSNVKKLQFITIAGRVISV